LAKQPSVKGQADNLIDLYMLLYEKANGHPATINRYKARWGFIDMVSDLGDDAVEVIKYYFKTKAFGHKPTDLFNKYDQLYTRMREEAEDAENREKLRRETERRVQEWEASLANERRTSN
jgi:hypothetical protein